MEKYLKIEKLGEGTYGHVYKAQNQISGSTPPPLPDVWRPRLTGFRGNRGPEEDTNGQRRGGDRDAPDTARCRPNQPAARAQGIPCTALREISLLKDLKHANVVGWVVAPPPPLAAGPGG